MSSVEIRGAEKSFGNVKVIHGLDLAIGDGEFVALVGPSGCGKSTLLRMLAGLEELSGGDILIGEKVVTNLNPRDRNIAMVFQSYALYPHMTVAENMSFNLKLSGKPKQEIRKRVDEAARMLDLSELLQRRPAQLSGGQRQRVAMGRAVVRSPNVFLFDEPLSNLDAKLRVQMRAEIKILHQRIGTTSIYVTHDQIEAMTLADRIVVLNRGRIEQEGSPLELYRRPQNLFVAGFIGSPAMNFIEARVRGGANGPEAVLSDKSVIKLAQTTRVSDGQPVTIGLRPENLVWHGAGSPLRGTTRIVEPTGAQTHVMFTVGGQDITAVIDGAIEVAPGEAFEVAITPELVHVFDKDTGQRLN
ncbi:MAG TPA: sn-glycerol-3-phosphate ABC transporter ATP-binding protein UgpC [Arsenicitalea sp.]|jgi:multiple sugar transport system ATP-binding protein|nr:sn-glycerol-3-phosphate ABC transporter ATP-binding protein UgpC [Arsenicitalea sp.]